MVGLTGAAVLQAVALLFPYINIVSHHKLQTYEITVLILLGAKIGVIGNNDMYTATTISFPKKDSICRIVQIAAAALLLAVEFSGSNLQTFHHAGMNSSNRPNMTLL